MAFLGSRPRQRCDSTRTPVAYRSPAGSTTPRGRPSAWCRQLPPRHRHRLRQSPPRFVHQPKPEYPVQARQQGWEGAVTLQLEMRADGTIGEARVVKSSGHVVLDTAAEEVAKTWTHVPAMHNGVAVTQWVTLNLTFTLDKESEAGAANRKPAQDR